MWGWLVYLGARARNPKWYIGFGLCFFALGVLRLIMGPGIEGGMIATGIGGFMALLGVAGLLGMSGTRSHS